MPNAIAGYFTSVHEILEKVEDTQAQPMEQAAQLIATTLREKKAIFTFGCNHAGLLAQELFYRSGGLVPVNYIRAPGLYNDVNPPTLTSEIERLEGYGKAIIKAQPIKKGDALIIHSVSGRNTVTIDVVLAAKEKGALIIGLTNLATASAVESRHSCGKNMHELCDIVIDNCGDFGDATLSLPGLNQNLAPTSTAVGAAILNAIVARAVELLLQEGLSAPIFMSANIPGGDEHNLRAIHECRDQIFYQTP